MSELINPVDKLVLIPYGEITNREIIYMRECGIIAVAVDDPQSVVIAMHNRPIVNYLN